MHALSNAIDQDREANALRRDLLLIASDVLQVDCSLLRCEASRGPSLEGAIRAARGRRCHEGVAMHPR